MFLRPAASRRFSWRFETVNRFTGRAYFRAEIRCSFLRRATALETLVGTRPKSRSCPIDSGARKVLLTGGSDARYVATGHIVYARGEVLFAQAFDLSRLEVIGGPVPVVQGLSRTPNPGFRRRNSELHTVGERHIRLRRPGVP